MTLAKRLERQFGPGDRSRGREYFGEGRVHVVRANELGALATVDGSRQYAVLLDWSQLSEDGLLFARCDCPRHEEGIWCKHVWATVLALDARGITLRTGSPEIHLAFDDPEFDDFGEMDDLDEWEEEPAPRGPDWEQKLTALERFLLIRGRDGEGVKREAGKETLFQIDADASRAQGELAVSFFERKRKRDGAWGKIRPARLRRADIASVEDPSESVLLELLFSLGARDALTRGFSMWGELKVGSATIPSSLNELIVPRLAKTGRLYWRVDHPEGELPPPLAWDDGPPYRLTLGLTSADAGKGTTLSASLQRGNEERSEAEVVILLRSGLVCFEDRIACLENPGDAFWASILRETGPITAPEKDTGQLIERLLNLPVRPPIELPPALAIREVKVRPMPWLRFLRPDPHDSALSAELQFDYQGTVFDAGDRRRGIFKRGSFTARDFDFERASHQLLAQLGFDSIPGSRPFWTLEAKRFPKAAARLIGVRMPAAQEMWKQFKLLQPLGKGGMGDVFLAEDTALDRKVALKFLPTALEEDGVARERFLREAKAAAALDHPYICKIYEIGEVEGKAYIAMEYIEGTTLFEKVASGPLPLPRVLELGAEIAEALDAAHKKQIVHRDIKSANIMVTPEGHVKILDFGLARMLAMEALSASKVDTYSGRLSSHDSTPGTVIYMSPEQVRGEPIDGRTDIFSLGVVLYEMATAKLPFQGATSGLIYDAILNLGPRPPTYHNPQVPPELDRIILKALEKDRDHRYQNARDLMVDLKRLKRDADAPRGSGVTSPGDWIKKRKGALAVAAILVAALGVGLFTFFRAKPSSTIDSLAVLPFENTRSDPEIDYLSEGIAETLINRLSPIPEIRVMARSTAFRYRGLDPLEAGRELKVGAVVTGRLVQQGDNLNVQAELVDVANGTQIWGEQYNRKLADIVAVQNEIAQSISRALALTLTGDEVTSDSEAYRAYWKGRFHWNRRTNSDLKKAIAFFEESLVRDPTLALAHVGLADSYVLLGAQFYGADPEFPPDAAMAKAREAAGRALALDLGLGEAYTSLAYISFLHDWNWEEAEKNFLAAIAKKPRYPVAHQWYSELLMVLGRHDEAIAQGREALALEPSSPILSRELGFKLYQARRYPEAIEQFQKTLELDPEFSLTRLMLTDALWDSGRKDEALAEAERIDEWRRTLFHLLDQGKTNEAQTWVDSIPRDAISPMLMSGLYARAGANEKAFALLEEGLSKRIPQLLTAVGRPVFDPIRSDPRFQKILRKIGLEP